MSFKLHEMLQEDCKIIAESELNLLLLMNDTHYPWFVLVPKVNDIKEIHQLTEPQQIQFIKESSYLSETLSILFSADKMNVAALGNMCPQLHIHHVVRYKSDAAWPAPIWGKVDTMPYSSEQFKSLLSRIESPLSLLFDFDL